ncbi:MAG: ABC transporter ATP-binding protein [Negativibacillus sp.]|nr:ABC transporter ATP-binding protein [Negativibacillus sp.]
MKTLVNVKDLSVSYFTYAGEVQSVRGVSFDIESGKTTALVGESGCGKSVTSKALMGLIERPGVVKEGSQILYEGKNILDFKEKEWLDFRGKECSMIFQDALVSLNPTMKIGKQIMENLENHNDEKLSKTEIRKRAQQMLELVGIPDAPACLDKYPHELSGGMRQRVMIATALITNPKLLIADEPTTALDVTIQAQILELMKQLQKKLGMAIIMITHDLGVVADMADEIIVMYAGKIVEKGSNEEIFYNPRHPYTWALMNSVPRLDLDNKEQLVTIEGTIPDMIHPPKGCAFCSRCPYAMNICAEYSPETIELKGGHQVACWLTDPRADVSGVPFHTGGEQDEQ